MTVLIGSPFEIRLTVDPVPVVNGMITAPERPGHGLRFKDEVRKEFAS